MEVSGCGSWPGPGSACRGPSLSKSPQWGLCGENVLPLECELIKAHPGPSMRPHLYEMSTVGQSVEPGYQGSGLGGQRG